jgi:hypothetical protein
MKNPIPNYKIFVTENLEDLIARIHNDYSGSEKALALRIAMMTINACHKEVEDKLFAS